MTFLTYCYKYTPDEKKRLIKLYKAHPSIFGYDLQRMGVKGYIKYISQEHVSNTLYPSDQFSPEYIISEHERNANTFYITRIVEIDILGNIKATILKAQSKNKGVNSIVPL
jgi:hypothetical protein